MITTLFADDTTVFLSKEDSFKAVKTILDKWCYASGAKFNEGKTIVIPVGTKTFRTDFVTTRRLREGTTPIPHKVKIATDGTPVRALGVFVGNEVDQAAVWAPTLEKIDTRLKQWDKSHPTQNGKRLIVGMEVGGNTQYLTRVQGMSPEIERRLAQRITSFMWDEKSSMVNAETLRAPLIDGGKNLLDIGARNEAIELMKLKSYLAPATVRPRWALVADSLFAEQIPQDQKIGRELRRQTFLQTWTPKIRGNSVLPRDLTKMLLVGRKYNVDFIPHSMSRDALSRMPIWHHKGFRDNTHPMNNGK